MKTNFIVGDRVQHIETQRKGEIVEILSHDQVRVLWRRKTTTVGTYDLILIGKVD